LNVKHAETKKTTINKKENIMKKLFVFAIVAMFSFAVMAQEPQRAERRVKEKSEKTKVAKAAKVEGSKEHKGCSQTCAHKKEEGKSCASAEKKGGCQKAAAGEEKKEGCQKAAAGGEKKSGCGSSCSHKKAAQRH